MVRKLDHVDADNVFVMTLHEVYTRFFFLHMRKGALEGQRMEL
jgi:hypothetical protein